MATKKDEQNSVFSIHCESDVSGHKGTTCKNLPFFVVRHLWTLLHTVLAFCTQLRPEQQSTVLTKINKIKKKARNQVGYHIVCGTFLIYLSALLTFRGQLLDDIGLVYPHVLCDLFVVTLEEAKLARWVEPLAPSFVAPKNDHAENCFTERYNVIVVKLLLGLTKYFRAVRMTSNVDVLVVDVLYEKKQKTKTSTLVAAAIYVTLTWLTDEGRRQR